jgi:hypothetical protein
MALTREQILARKVTGKPVPHDLGDGDTVMLRGLSRDEALEVQKKGQGGDLAGADNLLVHHGLVDPPLSVEDVAAWAAADSAGVLTGVSNHISEISGLSEGAGKSGVSRTRKRP